MSYNGFVDQDAFHQWIQEEWARMLSTPEGREQHRRAYGPGTTSHAGCDHANDYCVQTRDGHFTQRGKEAMSVFDAADWSSEWDQSLRPSTHRMDVMETIVLLTRHLTPLTLMIASTSYPNERVGGRYQHVWSLAQREAWLRGRAERLRIVS